MAEGVLQEWGGRFPTQGPTDQHAEQELVEYLEKIQRKDEVLAELMAEHMLLKKELGEL